ncbi:MAG: hypothetical protein WA947_06615 [Phormidesmis sp.]
MTNFQVGDLVLIPAQRAIYKRHDNSLQYFGNPSFGSYSYEDVFEEGEIVSLFTTDHRPAAVIKNYDLGKQLEYFLDGGIERDSRGDFSLEIVSCGHLEYSLKGRISQGEHQVHTVWGNSEHEINELVDEFVARQN